MFRILYPALFFTLLSAITCGITLPPQSAHAQGTVQAERTPISKSAIDVPADFSRRGFKKAHITDLYDFGGNIPLWHNQQDLPTDRAEKYAEILKNAGDDGLNPDDYGIGKIEKYLDKPGSKDIFKSPAEADIYLSSALLFYLSDLQYGRARLSPTDPEDFVSEPYHDSRRELLACLQNAKPEDCLENIRPKLPMYLELRKTLMKMKTEKQSDTAEELKKLKPEEIFIKAGNEHHAVPHIRNFLITEGFQPKSPLPDGISETYYDEATARAMRNYQFQYGLLADGVIGPKTIGFIRESFDGRREKLIMTLERLRSYRFNATKNKHVLVNISGFYAQALQDGGETEFFMPVIIGTGKRRTPEMISYIPSMTFAPYWMVPSKIARENTLPDIQKDPEYYTDMRFELLKHENGDRIIVDTEKFDWKNMTPSKFPPYRFRQLPGPQNALGPVRFNIVNNSDIFLHGTSHPELFVRTNRNLSSGCVRLKDPWQMIKFITENNSSFTENKLLSFYNKAIEGVKGFASYTITLDKDVPVHIVYWTAWTDEKGLVHYSRDIYNRDEKLGNIIKNQGMHR